MRNLSYISTHADDGANRILTSLRGDNFEGFLRVFLQRYQGVEDTAYSLIQGRYLSDATGFTLEQIGLKVGQPRPKIGAAATNDNAYRILIYAKIAENISYGTLPDLYNILGSLQLERVKIFPVYPASLTINFISNSLTLTCGCIRAIIARATPPVTAIDITQHSAHPFGFEGDNSAFGFDDGEIGEGV